MKNFFDMVESIKQGKNKISVGIDPTEDEPNGYCAFGINGIHLQTILKTKEDLYAVIDWLKQFDDRTVSIGRMLDEEEEVAGVEGDLGYMVTTQIPPTIKQRQPKQAGGMSFVAHDEESSKLPSMTTEENPDE